MAVMTTANADTEVTIYLLHFERPYKGKMRHYLGFTRDLDNRLENHRRGTACVTTKRAFDRGIGFVLARTWLGPVRLERAIKRHGVVRSCPICTPDQTSTNEGRQEGASNLQVPMVLP